MSNTISDKTYMELKEQIISGDLPPGSFLVEQDLANSLGVSRTPVKSALRRLEADGLIEAEGRKRAIVKEFNVHETKEILDIRAMLESYACKRAASRISDEQLERLDWLAAEMEGLADLPVADAESLKRFSLLNDEFHQIIITAANSKRLEELMRPIFQLHILLMGRFQTRIEVNLKRSCWHHREIIAALKDRNEEWAMMQMQTHLFAAGSWKSDEELLDDPEND